MENEKIYQYLKESGLTKKELAKQCKLNEKWFYWALKHGKIGPHTADMLDYHTNGRIPYDSLTNLPRPRKAKRRKKAEEIF